MNAYLMRQLPLFRETLIEGSFSVLFLLKVIMNPDEKLIKDKKRDKMPMLENRAILQ